MTETKNPKDVFNEDQQKQLIKMIDSISNLAIIRADKEDVKIISALRKLKDDLTKEEG